MDSNLGPGDGELRVFACRRGRKLPRRQFKPW
jgi:hypothetical protein